MRSPRAFLLLCLLPIAGTAHPIHVEPVDFSRAFFNERQRLLGTQGALAADDAYWTDRLLVQGPLPVDAYAETQPWNDRMDDPAWQAAVASVSSAGHPVTRDMALWMLQWDMGFTKARPALDVGVVNDRGYGDGLVAANAVKAGVSPDIFRQALAIYGNDHSTIAAKFAVAAQILHDRARSAPPERDDVLHIRRDVLERFMGLSEGESLEPYDAHYFMGLLDEATRTRVTGRRSFTGERELATPYRVARVAAAYRQQQGYVTAPCDVMGRRVEDIASADTANGAAMCFNDAHDRAVFDWYNGEFRRQARGLIETSRHPGGLTALLALLAPFSALLDVMAVAEFSETLLAEDLAGTGELAEDDAALYENRLDTLMCRRAP